MVGKWCRESLEVSLGSNDGKCSGKFRPRKWFSVKTKHSLKYMKNNPTPFSREKKRQMGLVIPHKKVDKKDRSALGVPVILIPTVTLQSASRV